MRNGATIRVVLSELDDVRSPVPTPTETLLTVADIEQGHSLNLSSTFDETLLYVITGSIELSGKTFGAGAAVVVSRLSVSLTAHKLTQIAYFGGAKLDAPRLMWWNFVSSRQARIDQAKHDWREGKFAAVPNDPGPNIPPAGIGPNQALGGRLLTRIGRVVSSEKVRCSGASRGASRAASRAS